MDSDVEIHLPFDRFFEHEAFTGFETRGLPFTAVWGSTRNHSLTRAVLDYYDGRQWSAKEPPNTAPVTRLLEELYGVDSSKDAFQECKDGLFIYPSSTFCLDLPRNYATHHFLGSWLPREVGKYKKAVNLQYHIDCLMRDSPSEAVAELVFEVMRVKGGRLRGVMAILGSIPIIVRRVWKRGTTSILRGR